MHGNLIPRLNDVRRVSDRYHRVLPLPVIKRHQCIVVGKSARNLTVGIPEYEREQAGLLDFLQTLTGAAIFPVLVEPRRMHLLITRMERYQHFRRRYSRAYYVLQLPAQVRTVLSLIEMEKNR